MKNQDLNNICANHINHFNERLECHKTRVTTSQRACHMHLRAARMTR